MRRIFSKTFKFRNLTVSFFPDEILVIYVGQVTVHVKSFRKPVISRRQKLLIGVSSALVFVLLSTTTWLLSSSDMDAVAEDDAIKNKVLLSSKTDYSSPAENKPLKISEHRVKPGETLSSIASRYGVSIDTVCGSNNLRSYDFISTGIKLKIPNKDGILYTMGRGGNLVGIARQYGVSLRKIIDENALRNQDFVPVNRVLFIPDAKPQNIFVGFMWPSCSRFITCGYGWRRNPFTGGQPEFHQGLDVRSVYTWVKASKYGKVTFTGWLGGYGKAVVLAHPGGWKTLYAHLSRVVVREGQYVKQGQSIAVSGNTGRSTGAHLHFEIIKNGVHKNPYYYIKANR